jgi:general secretion pathway protein K
MIGTRRAGQSGVALLVVLLAITLLTVVVLEFTDSSQVETHLALGGRNALQAYYLARSGVNAAEDILVLDAATDQNGADTDGENDIWARPLPPWPIGDGTVVLQVTDETRRLDVNTLAAARRGDNRESIRVFANLFQILGLEASLLSAIVDWLDPNGDPETSPPGAEQPYYLGLTPPVVVPNGPVHSVRDLLGVRGMSPEILARLEPYVTALPVETGTPSVKINVNTAPAEALLALAATRAKARAVVDRLIEARGEQTFASQGALQQAVPQLKGTIWSEIGDHVVYGSTYFRIQSVGTVGGVARGLTVVVKRNTSAPVTITRVRWTPNTVPATLTSQRPSDLVEALPPLGGR